MNLITNKERYSREVQCVKIVAFDLVDIVKDFKLFKKEEVNLGLFILNIIRFEERIKIILKTAMII